MGAKGLERLSTNDTTIKRKQALRYVSRTAATGVEAHSESANVDIFTSLKSAQRTCAGDLAPHVVENLKRISGSDKAGQTKRYRRLVK